MGFFTKNSTFNSSLDIHENIMIVSSNEEVKYINKAGLRFFGFDSFSDFKKSHKYSIDTLFIEDEGCINRYSLGKKWLSVIYDGKSKIKGRTIKVKLYSHIDDMEQLKARIESGEFVEMVEKEVGELLIVHEKES